MSAPNWNEFERKRNGPAVLSAGDSPEAVCARVFMTTDGRELMKVLYALTIDRRCRAGASEAELREFEAQRRLVSDLERLRDRGLETMAMTKKN